MYKTRYAFVSEELNQLQHRLHESETTIISFLCFQLAGVVAVEVTGGPTVNFVPGRRVCCAIPFVRILVMKS